MQLASKLARTSTKVAISIGRRLGSPDDPNSRFLGDFFAPNVEMGDFFAPNSRFLGDFSGGDEMLETLAGAIWHHLVRLVGLGSQCCWLQRWRGAPLGRRLLRAGARDVASFCLRAEFTLR